jgi:hypothetical protein
VGWHVAVKRAGFTARELEVVRANIRSDLLADYVERDQMDSADVCDEIVDHFLRKDPVRHTRSKIVEAWWVD